jgi:hypothetical protein
MGGSAQGSRRATNKAQLVSPPGRGPASRRKAPACDRAVVGRRVAECERTVDGARRRRALLLLAEGREGGSRGMRKALLRGRKSARRCFETWRASAGSSDSSWTDMVHGVSDVIGPCQPCLRAELSAMYPVTVDNLKSGPNLSTCRGNPNSSRSPTTGCGPAAAARAWVLDDRAALGLACCTGREGPSR